MKGHAQMETDNTLHNDLQIDYYKNFTDRQFQYTYMIFNYYQTQLFLYNYNLKDSQITLSNLKHCLPYKENVTLPSTSTFLILIQNTTEPNLISDLFGLCPSLFRNYIDIIILSP